MNCPDTITIGGHAYSWRQLCEQRRQQVAAWKEAQPQQPALFALREDARPVTQRRAAGRYLEPSLLEVGR
jgi:hypothetical protein